MELKENLSKNLILLRGPKSQAAFSEKLGVTKSTIQAIEAKKSAVRLDTLDIIARNLGLPAPALLSEELTWEGAKLLPYILERAEWFVQLSNRDRNDILSAQKVCLPNREEITLKNYRPPSCTRCTSGSPPLMGQWKSTSQCPS